MHLLLLGRELAASDDAYAMLQNEHRRARLALRSLPRQAARAPTHDRAQGDALGEPSRATKALANAAVAPQALPQESLRALEHWSVAGAEAHGATRVKRDGIPADADAVVAKAAALGTSSPAVSSTLRSDARSGAVVEARAGSAVVVAQVDTVAALASDATAANCDVAANRDAVDPIHKI